MLVNFDFDFQSVHHHKVPSYVGSYTMSVSSVLRKPDDNYLMLCSSLSTDADCNLDDDIKCLVGDPEGDGVDVDSHFYIQRQGLTSPNTELHALLDTNNNAFVCWYSRLCASDLCKIFCQVCIFLFLSLSLCIQTPLNTNVFLSIQTAL